MATVISTEAEKSVLPVPGLGMWWSVRHSVMNKTSYVYILTNESRTLYIGVTADLPRRLEQHRSGHGKSFTARYRIWRLVYAESFGDINAAIAREKQLKRWRREKKVALVASVNPTWQEIAAW